MEHNDYWNKFILTGAVEDYLKYAACSDGYEEISCTGQEGESSDSVREHDWYGAIGYAGWGL